MSVTRSFAIYKATALVLLASSCSYAVSFSDFDRQPGNSLHSRQKYMKTNAQENINPATGGLTLVVTDLSLPGRNGFDLNINRVYRSRHYITSKANNWLSDADFVPQWSNLGMGWKCFIARFERHLEGTDYPTATVYMGDGSTYEFLSNDNSVYYCRGPENLKVVINNGRPVLYFPNGHKYIFGYRVTQTTVGVFGDQYSVTEMRDNNGNFIGVFYDDEVGGTEIKYIIDTWGRRIDFYWTDDFQLSYAGLGAEPKKKLSSLQVWSMGEKIKDISYLYDTLTVCDTIINSGVRHANMKVTVLKAVFSGSQCMVRYNYGRKNNDYEYYDVKTSLPNADRGQLTEIIYPWGGRDKYFYKLVTDYQVWGTSTEAASAKIFSIIDKKGNQDYDDLWVFKYSSTEFGPGDRMGSYDYWDTSVVSNYREKVSTRYIYGDQYLSYDQLTHIPLVVKQYDSLFDFPGNKITLYSRNIRNVTQGQKAVPLLAETRIYEGSQMPDDLISDVCYEYVSDADFNLTNYDNVMAVEERGSDGFWKRTEYTYLHFDNPFAIRYNSGGTWMLDRKLSQKIYDSQGKLIRSSRNEYDALPCSTYNNGDILFPITNFLDSFNTASPSLPRGNINRVVEYLLAYTGNPYDSLINTNVYDVCGNPVWQINPLRDSIRNEFRMSLAPYVTVDSGIVNVPMNVPGGDYGTTFGNPNYLSSSHNPVYGQANWVSLNKMGLKEYEWNRQSGNAKYVYEPVYDRLIREYGEGDLDNSSSKSYDYKDFFSSAYNFPIPSVNTFNEDLQVLLNEDIKQDEGKFINRIRYYYDKNGNLCKKEQGNVTADYSYNTLGLLKRETNPYFSNQAAGGQTIYEYDGLKRLTRVTFPDSGTMVYNYGPLWRSITDANGNTTTYRFNMQGQLISVTDPMNNCTSYEYDVMGSLLKITTPDGKESRYHYDPIGRLIGKYDVDADSSLYMYDKASNLIRYQDRNLMNDLKILRNSYDKIGRLTSAYLVSYQDSTLLVGNTYDTYSGVLSPAEQQGASPGESLSVYNRASVRETNYSNLNPADTSIAESYINIKSPVDDYYISCSSDTTEGSLTKRDEHLIAGRSFYISENYSEESYSNSYLETYFVPDMYKSSLSLINESIQYNATIQSCSLYIYQGGVTNLKGLAISGSNGVQDGEALLPSSGWLNWDITSYVSLDCLLPYMIKLGSFAFTFKKDVIDSTGISFEQEVFFRSSRYPDESYRPRLMLKYQSVDNEPPVLSSLRATTFADGCHIEWAYQNDWTLDTLYYGTTALDKCIAAPCTVMTHDVQLAGLSPDQTYRFQIIGRDVTGNRSVSQEYSFTTDTLEYIGYAVKELNPYSAKIEWQLNFPCLTTIRYGEDPSCPSSVSTTNSFVYLNGLIPGKKYYFRLESVGYGDKLSSPLLSFVTPGIKLFGKSTGLLTRTVDQSGETVYGYDEQGRTVTRRVKYNDSDKRYYFNYGYDRADNLAFLGYPDGQRKRYSYDSYNRLASVSDHNGNAVKQFTYNATGACSTETYPNGVNGVYSYYPRLWLKNASLNKGTSKYFNHTYGYDPVGNLTSDNDYTGLSSSINRYYGYDALNRLTGEVATTKSLIEVPQSIYYDAMGNRVSTSSTLGDITYQYYPGTNRLEKEIAADGLEKIYGYDANGNMNNDGIWSYEYDAQNKLKKVYKYVSNGSTNIEYLYNSSGLRVKEKKTDVVTNTGGGTTLAEATFPETFDDLVLNAPSGDGHDDARDMGKLKVHVSDSFLFFTIEHKYLYGTSQGDYENIYIAMDTDQEFGSGSTLLPDDIKVSVSADNAWEYCAYVYSEDDFGIYIGEGFKLENLVTADGKKMKVNFTNGKNSKAIIKIPLALIGNARKIRFAIVSTMPGAPSYVETSVCDVLPGGRLALDGTLITQYNEFVAPAPGTTITTVDTKYNLYDDGGQVLCDLDEYGNITKRYVYAGGKHVAMDLPGNKDYMTNGGFEYGNFEYPLSPWGKWAPDGQTSAVNWQIVSDVKRSGTYSAKATAFSATSVQNYAQNVSLPVLPFTASCYMKAQDLTGGVYLIVECWTAGYGTPLGNKYSNLRLGTNDSWELLSLVVNDLPPNTGAIKVTLQRLSGTGTVWVDDVRCEEGVSRKEDKSYYYHTDYLGSPRVMTDQLGNVIWRQDYYAFGADYNTSATGNTHKFTGHVKDDATGQYYAKNRYFTTNTGRWSQPEPLLDGVPDIYFLINPQKLNPYVYCLNNPLRFIDPDGFEELKALEYALDNLQNIPYKAGLVWPKNRDYKAGEIPSTLVCNEYTFVAYRNAGHSDYPYSIDDQKAWFENNGRYTNDINAGQKGDVMFLKYDNGGQHAVMVADVKVENGVTKYLVVGARGSSRPSGYSVDKNTQKPLWVIPGTTSGFKNFTGFGQINYKKQNTNTSAPISTNSGPKTIASGNAWYWLQMHGVK